MKNCKVNTNLVPSKVGLFGLMSGKKYTIELSPLATTDLHVLLIIINKTINMFSSLILDLSLLLILTKF